MAAKFFPSNVSREKCSCVAGVVVSCKIPILATRVRFPGDATFTKKYDCDKTRTCNPQIPFFYIMIPSARVA